MWELLIMIYSTRIEKSISFLTVSTLLTPSERYSYSLTSVEQTGFAVASCTDNVTGMVVRTPLASTERSFPAFIAYVGARFSRSRDGLITLMGKVEDAYQQGKSTPDQRLANIVQGLKHQSPGGMAHVALSIENVPILTAASLFRRTTLHDGQEASTRYIDFSSGNDLPELTTLLPPGVEVPVGLVEKYKQLQSKSLQLYLSWFPKVFDAYKKHFQINEQEKSEIDALTARTYDTVRGFLLSGFKTSMVYVTNATTMQQMLSDFGSNRLPGESQLAESIMALLTPASSVSGYSAEIKALLNHTTPDTRTREEQQRLDKYLSMQLGFNELLMSRRSFSGLVDNQCTLLPASLSPADRIIAQHLMVLHPSLVVSKVSEFVTTLNDHQRMEIGQIIFGSRNRFTLPAISSSGGPIGLHFGIDLGIERDLGRHRAWERVSPIHETHVGLNEVSQTGFTQAAYLRQISGFATIQQGMESDMNHYYQQRHEFLMELSAISGKQSADIVGMYLLPLAHHVDMFMSGDVRYLVHLQDIRIREGAHIDARLVVASANRQVAQSDPLFSSLAYPENRVVVDSRSQFVSRD